MTSKHQVYKDQILGNFGHPSSTEHFLSQIGIMLPVILYSGFILLLASLTSAKRIEHNWDITYTTANPDGLFERVVIGVNGKWP